jgi:hypothetical protein
MLLARVEYRGLPIVVIWQPLCHVGKRHHTSSMCRSETMRRTYKMFKDAIDAAADAEDAWEQGHLPQ